MLNLDLLIQCQWQKIISITVKGFLESRSMQHQQMKGIIWKLTVRGCLKINPIERKYLKLLPFPPCPWACSFWWVFCRPFFRDIFYRNPTEDRWPEACQIFRCSEFFRWNESLIIFEKELCVWSHCIVNKVLCIEQNSNYIVASLSQIFL